jgi:PAS domain S-box-containing protein
VDSHLGERNGIQLIQEARKSGLTMPIILFTRHGNHEMDLEAMLAGATNYLEKDQTPALLERTIRRSIEIVSERYRYEAANGTCCKMQVAVAEIGRLESQFRSLFENSPDAVLIATDEGVYLDANPAACDLLAVPYDKIIGRTIDDFTEQDSMAEGSFAREVSLRAGKVQRLIRLQQPDGTILDVNFFATANFVPGRHLSVLRDITEHRKDEEKIRQIATELAEAQSLAHVGSWNWNLQTKVLTWSDEHYRIFGINPGEIDPHYESVVAKYIHPEDRDLLKGFVETCLRTLEPFSFLYRVVPPNGAVRVIHSCGKVIADEKGRPIKMLGTAQDVTECKQREEEQGQLNAQLESQRQRMNDIVASVPGVVWEAWGQPDTNAQRINFVSDYVETMLGYKVEEWLSTPNFWLTIVHPDDREQAGRDAAADFISGKTIIRREFRWLTKDGRVLWVESQSVIARDAHGHPVGMRGVTLDISERKQAEEELRRQLDFNEALTTGLGEGVYAVDARGRLTFMNPAAEVALGWKQAELLGQDAHEVIHFQNAEGTRTLADDCPLQRTLKSGDSINIEDDVFTRKDGKMFHVSISSSPIVTSAQRVGAVLAFRDVTERRALEEELRQSQKMEAVGRLAGGIAHDFNNLLTVINGYSELTLRHQPLDQALARNVGEIKKAGQRAASLTRQLLAFSRKQVLEPRILDLNTVISDLKTMLQRLIGEDIDLRTVHQPGLLRVNADPGQIEQVIMNLVINARDAMPDGGRLTIETENVILSDEYVRHHLGVKPGPYAMVAISDDGSGMDDETKVRLFEPFYTTKDLDKGTGLGLSTVYGIVKQSMGNIWVYSEKGLGTTFKVYLPSVHAEVEDEQPIQTTQPAAPVSETILLVEDDETVRTLTRMNLEEAGYKVLQAANGDEALPICEQYSEAIHLLLTDVVMPGMSGRVVANCLKNLHPEMIVLYMSGYTADAIVHRGVLNAGVNFIAKPFATTALTRKVRELLDAA